MASVVQAPMIQAPAVPVAALAPGRDLRLDLFRGLALWLIFLDHVPNNIVAWFTIRNYGFSDATEIASASEALRIKSQSANGNIISSTM